MFNLPRDFQQVLLRHFSWLAIIVSSILKLILMTRKKITAITIKQSWRESCAKKKKIAFKWNVSTLFGHLIKESRNEDELQWRRRKYHRTQSDLQLYRHFSLKTFFTAQFKCHKTRNNRDTPACEFTSDLHKHSYPPWIFPILCHLKNAARQ